MTRSAERLAYAAQLATVFRDAGWSLNGMGVEDRGAVTYPHGVFLSVRDRNHLPPAAHYIRVAFEEADVPLGMGLAGKFSGLAPEEPWN